MAEDDAGGAAIGLDRVRRVPRARRRVCRWPSRAATGSARRPTAPDPASYGRACGSALLSLFWRSHHPDRYYRLSLSAPAFLGAATFLLGCQLFPLGLALSLLCLRAHLGELPSFLIAKFGGRIRLAYAFPFPLQERVHPIQGFLPDFVGEPRNIQAIRVNKGIAWVWTVFVKQMLAAVTDQGLQVRRRHFDNTAEPAQQRGVIHKSNTTLR